MSSGWIGTPIASNHFIEAKVVLLRSAIQARNTIQEDRIMLTATCESAVAQSTTPAQNETLLSDTEISQRVMAIRNQWSVSERVQRRRVAEERFVDLLDALCLAEAA